MNLKQNPKFLRFCYCFLETKSSIFVPQFGGLAHLARALAWQARGGRFESDILHIRPSRLFRGGFFIFLFLVLPQLSPIPCTNLPQIFLPELPSRICKLELPILSLVNMQDHKYPNGRNSPLQNQ